jgi:hypothetical protein
MTDDIRLRLGNADTVEGTHGESPESGDDHSPDRRRFSNRPAPGDKESDAHD